MADAALVLCSDAPGVTTGRIAYSMDVLDRPELLSIAVAKTAAGSHAHATHARQTIRQREASAPSRRTMAIPSARISRPPRKSAATINGTLKCGRPTIRWPWPTASADPS